MTVVLIRDRGDWLIVAGDTVVARCPEREWAEWLAGAVQDRPRSEWPDALEPF